MEELRRKLGRLIVVGEHALRRRGVIGPSLRWRPFLPDALRTTFEVIVRAATRFPLEREG